MNDKDIDDLINRIDNNEARDDTDCLMYLALVTGTPLETLEARLAVIRDEPLLVCPDSL